MQQKTQQQLTIALPGLIWQHPGDIKYLYRQLQEQKNYDILKVIRYGKLIKHKFSYSDLICEIMFPEAYVTAKKYNTLANYLATIHIKDRGFKNYLIVEPTHLQVDNHQALITPTEELHLDDLKAQYIITQLNRYFANDNTKLYYIHNTMWLLGTDYAINSENICATSQPLIDIIGKNIDDYLPKDDMVYNRLLNEIQMVLFGSNTSLLADDCPKPKDKDLAINSVWLWDKDLSRSTCSKIANRGNLQPTKFFSNNQDLVKNSSRVIDFSNNNLFAVFNHPDSCLIIDSLHSACNSCDGFAWLNKLSTINEKWLNPILTNIVKQSNWNLNLLIPMHNYTLEFKFNRYSRYQIWQHHNLIDLTQGQINENEY